MITLIFLIILIYLLNNHITLGYFSNSIIEHY